MEKGKFFSGLFIMVGLIVLGAMIPFAANVFRSYERTVNVKGLCEKEVQADKVIWPLVVKLSSNDLNDVNSQMRNCNKTIKEFLVKGGIPEEAITFSSSISDSYTLEYSNNRPFRYICKTVATVCTTDVEAVVALQEKQNELLAKGVLLEQSDWENPVTFSFEGLNEIKPEMIEEATKNARATALKFAEDSGSKLGKIKNASQGTFSITDRDSNTPYIKNVRVVTSITYYLSK